MLMGSALVLTLPSRALALLRRPGIVAATLPFDAELLRCEIVWNERAEADDGLKWFIALLRDTVTSAVGECERRH